MSRVLLHAGFSIGKALGSANMRDAVDQRIAESIVDPVLPATLLPAVARL